MAGYQDKIIEKSVIPFRKQEELLKEMCLFGNLREQGEKVDLEYSAEGERPATKADGEPLDSYIPK